MQDNDVLIGFEFEFGWDPTQKKHSRPKSKAHYFDEVVEPEIQEALKLNFEEELSCVEDCTVRFDKDTSYWKTSFGAEVVTPPFTKELALKFLEKFLRWMQSHSQISTNNTCSLHVNVSYVDQAKNKKINYLQLLQDCPQETILKRYGRLQNRYTLPFSKVKYSLRTATHCTASKSCKQWSLLTSRIYSKIYLKAIPLKYGWESYETNKEQSESHCFEYSNFELKKVLKQECLKTLESSKKGLAIVKKKSESGPYYEFRMIGGKNYEYRGDEILSTINMYLGSLSKAVT